LVSVRIALWTPHRARAKDAKLRPGLASQPDHHRDAVPVTVVARRGPGVVELVVGTVELVAGVVELAVPDAEAFLAALEVVVRVVEDLFATLDVVVRVVEVAEVVLAAVEVVFAAVVVGCDAETPWLPWLVTGTGRTTR